VLLAASDVSGSIEGILIHLLLKNIIYVIIHMMFVISSSILGFSILGFIYGLLIFFILIYIIYIIIHTLLVISSIFGFIYSMFTLSNLNTIKDVINSLNGIIIGSLVLIFVSGLLFFLSKKRKETIIVPFKVNSSKKTYNGNIISDSLFIELIKIKETYDRKFEEESITCEDIFLPLLAPSAEQLETTFSNLGNVSVAGMTLSIGDLLTVLKLFWPLGEQARTIKGSLQEYDSEIHLIVRMEGFRTHIWKIALKIEQSTNKEMIPELIKDLAFMITYDLSKEEPKKTEGITAKTWIGLKYFTEALDSYSQYKVTKKPKHRENAWKNCIKASQEEKDYQKLFNLFYSLGISYLNTNDYSYAEDAFRRCIDLAPNSEKSFIGLGAPLFYLGRYKDALEAYGKALKINPNNAEAWNNTGNALGNLGPKEEALVAFNKALVINPECASALFGKGNTLCDLGRYEEALEAYEKSLEIDSEYADAWNGKGYTLGKLGRHEEALEAYEKALEIKPEYADSWDNKGVVLGKLGRLEEALKAYEKALEIDSNNAGAYYNRACAYSLMNLKNEALADLKCAVELDPSYRETAKTDKVFEKLWEDRDFKEIITTKEED
jgi:tetratricopeptide (TPR) repeat protein